jgi:hypothetical protein
VLRTSPAADVVVAAAVEDEDAPDRSPKEAAIAAMTTSRPARRSLRLRIRRLVVRADAR